MSIYPELEEKKACYSKRTFKAYTEIQ